MFNINTKQDIDNQFIHIAKQLFAKYELVVNEAVFDFCEIEFYFKSKNHHDPYIHGDDMQLTNSQWYFHGSGIDFTIGDGKNYGGILIRGIKRLGEENEKFISGPLLVAKEIFYHFGDIIINKISLGIRKKETPRLIQENDFIASTRINLPQREDKEDFKGRKYRYLTYIKPEHPFKEKEIIAKFFKTDKKLSAEVINKLFGYKIIKE